MKELFKRTTNSIICSSIIALIIGFIMVIMPTISIKTIGLITAIYIILHGLVMIILDVKANKYYIPFDGMLPGILSLLIGILLIAKPSILTTLFTIVIGVWVLLSSINSIKLSLVLKSEDASWIWLLLLALLDLIVGIIIIFNPFEALLSMTVFVGIMLIIHSIVNIVDMIVIKKDAKKISKAIEKRLKEI